MKNDKITWNQDHLDDEYFYGEFLKENDRSLEQEAEKQEFFSIFEASGTYPF